MADNKKWFKVWTCLLTDPEFDDLHNQAIGVWVRIGALVAQHGDNGEMIISKQQFLKRTHLQNISESDLKTIIIDLEKINLRITFLDTGLTSVSFQKWRKYQTDYDGYERVKKWRKGQNDTGRETQQIEKRREEKRREKEENINTKKKVVLSDDEWIVSLQKNIAYEGLDIKKELAKCTEYFSEIKVSRKRFLNWLNRAINFNKPIKFKKEKLIDQYPIL